MTMRTAAPTASFLALRSTASIARLLLWSCVRSRNWRSGSYLLRAAATGSCNHDKERHNKCCSDFPHAGDSVCPRYIVNNLGAGGGVVTTFC